MRQAVPVNIKVKDQTGEEIWGRFDLRHDVAGAQEAVLTFQSSHETLN